MIFQIVKESGGKKFFYLAVYLLVNSLILGGNMTAWPALVNNSLHKVLTCKNGNRITKVVYSKW